MKPLVDVLANEEKIRADLLEQCELFLGWLTVASEIIPNDIHFKLPSFDSKRLKEVIARAKGESQ